MASCFQHSDDEDYVNFISDNMGLLKSDTARGILHLLHRECSMQNSELLEDEVVRSYQLLCYLQSSSTLDNDVVITLSKTDVLPVKSKLQREIPSDPRSKKRKDPMTGPANLEISVKEYALRRPPQCVEVKPLSMHLTKNDRNPCQPNFLKNCTFELQGFENFHWNDEDVTAALAHCQTNHTRPNAKESAKGGIVAKMVNILLQCPAISDKIDVHNTMAVLNTRYRPCKRQKRDNRVNKNSKKELIRPLAHKVLEKLNEQDERDEITFESDDSYEEFDYTYQ